MRIGVAVLIFSMGFLFGWKAGRHTGQPLISHVEPDGGVVLTSGQYLTREQFNAQSWTPK